MSARTPASSGGRVLYSGPPAGLREVARVADARATCSPRPEPRASAPRTPPGWLRLAGITRNNLHELDARFPLGVLTAVTGVSGSGKSSLVSQALVELVAAHLGHEPPDGGGEADELRAGRRRRRRGGRIAGGMERDPAARARRPEADRPHAALEPRHLHRPVRSRPQALRRDAEARAGAATTPGRFSFNVAKGRCATCEGEGFVSVELLFMPSVYAPCPDLPRRALQREDAGDRLAAARASPTCCA